MGAGLTLIIGGARSGKSAFAEKLAARHEAVLFVATAEALDDEMQQRIENHKRNRPDSWHTLETPRDIVTGLESTPPHDVLLLDCLTLWVSNLLLDMEEGQADTEQRIAAEAERLLAAYEASNAEWIVVTNEVGQGVVPPTVLGRAFRDTLGRVNQLFAARADKVYQMTAGLAVDIKRLSEHE